MAVDIQNKTKMRPLFNFKKTKQIVYSGENGEKLQRRYSWKISRPSLRRKSKFSNAESENDDQGILVLNNNSFLGNTRYKNYIMKYNFNSKCPSSFLFFMYSGGYDHSQCNGGVSKNPSPNFLTTNNILSEYNTVERPQSSLQQVIYLKL